MRGKMMAMTLGIGLLMSGLGGCAGWRVKGCVVVADRVGCVTLREGWK